MSDHGSPVSDSVMRRRRRRHCLVVTPAQYPSISLLCQLRFNSWVAAAIDTFAIVVYHDPDGFRSAGRLLHGRPDPTTTRLFDACFMSMFRPSRNFMTESTAGAGA
ncbi:MAG: hypothetical protein M5R36_16115 [Deltaproteobacteria bacterium]|nr:hypothetical protein [Deltaproteobacteria bacterium]